MEYKGAGVIIYNNDSFVIVKGNQNIYSFPKGHLKKSINENLEECALRELYEETGLTYSIDFLKTCKTIVIYEYIYFIIILDNKVNNFIIHDNNERLSCDWMSIPELLSVYYKCNQGIKKILTNWNFYKNIFIKSN